MARFSLQLWLVKDIEHQILVVIYKVSTID